MVDFDETKKFRWKTEIESAYIITIKNNSLSESMAQRCAESCVRADMPWKRWDAFDGTKNKIIVPDHLQSQNWIRWIKVVNEALASSEVCTLLSHLSLWAHCVELDQPIVILEHDAVLLKKVLEHPAVNAIVYLGSIEQVKNNFYHNPIAIMGQLNENYRFILRTHSYSIDPIMARRLISTILENGITQSVDVFIRSDIFCQVQFGVFAFDMNNGVSTAPEKDNKNKDERLTRINSKII